MFQLRKEKPDKALATTANTKSGAEQVICNTGQILPIKEKHGAI